MIKAFLGVDGYDATNEDLIRYVLRISENESIMYFLEDRIKSII